MLAYEKLDVYQASIKFLVIASEYLEKLPQGNRALSDQLKRASLSVPLNIAEGTGKISKPDTVKFYGIARGSAMECGAIFDACKAMELADVETVSNAKAILERIVRMLTKMCR